MGHPSSVMVRKCPFHASKIGVFVLGFRQKYMIEPSHCFLLDLGFDLSMQ